ncbi:hypothetical protein ACY2DA_00210 [Staphylococcus simulans]
MRMTNSTVLDEITELRKMLEKNQITNVIAPEHNKRHHDHENKMKKEEKVLVEQIISHCDSFKSEFEKSAKGAWVDSALSELKDISNNLKSIMD